MPALSFQQIRDDIIGENHPIRTPFGEKPLVYADYTASGRSLRSIETFIQQKVLPYYANTHSESSFTGRQTTALREQSREAIRQALGADSDYQLIFSGSGATAAINKLINMLNLAKPPAQSIPAKPIPALADEQRPVVFTGPYEHHSNELPWRESIATHICIPLNDQGQLDIVCLESELQKYQNRPMKIGSFSAASNVTGIKTDVQEVTELLHRYHALSFWDYAAAGPYVGIDLNTLNADALFLSPHKFIGGPGTPGLLVVHQRIVDNVVPAMPGGGTVLYVTPEDHRYTDDIQRKEEAGTPGIVESIRAGLVFQLQQQVGTERIEHREQTLVRQLLKRWQAHPHIRILGPTEADRLSICSFQITCDIGQGQTLPLHYGFVVALLNDLFGIQARGGCSCAGPYGHHLLNLEMSVSKKLEALIAQGHSLLRPGWVRINLNYFIDDASAHYILRAVELIAEHGWRLLPAYQYDYQKGVWYYAGENSEGRVSGKINVSGTTEGSEATDKSGKLEESEKGHKAGQKGRHNTLPVHLRDALSSGVSGQSEPQAQVVSEFYSTHESYSNSPSAETTGYPDFQTLLAEAEQHLTAKHPFRYALQLPDPVMDLCWFVLPQSVFNRLSF